MLTRFLLIALLAFPQAALAANDGYCWNDKVGWVDMSGVTFSDSSRQFGGSATYFDGTFDGETFGQGEIDFTAQGSLSVRLSTSRNRDEWPIEGQAFSEQLGWVVADHGGTAPAVMLSSGELSGNFWSNEVGWFNCPSDDVGSAYVQVWNPGNATRIGGGAAARQARARRSQEEPTYNDTESPSLADVGIYVPDDEAGEQHAGTGADLPTEQEVLPYELDAPPEPQRVTTPFRDIPPDSWFALPVKELHARGILSGYKDEEGNPLWLFRPERPLGLGEALKLAIELAGTDVAGMRRVTPENRTARTHWSAPYAVFSERKGMSAPQSTDDVAAPLSRSLFLQLLVESLGLETRDRDTVFTDVPTTHPHAAAIALAVKRGWITGDTLKDGTPLNTFRPDAPLNRAEAAAVIKRVMAGM